LGIWELKWQLEDLSFSYLQPQKYRRVSRLVAARRAQREDFIAQVAQVLKKEFQKGGVKADIAGRPKHIYSIYKKIEKYAAQGKRFGDIHDLFALRVLVDTVADCYSALGITHNLWRPFPEEFDDFIANPKGNGYQSLHTTVMCFGTTLLEVQIRTWEMHRISEYGVAAHWRYKEGEKRDLKFEQKIAWLRQLLEWHRELSPAEEFLESVKTDIFIDQVFVYSPKGEIKGLPKGATPLDFAYHIHTDLGHRCIGAKVNGRLVTLNYQLNNGDSVEILSTRRAKGPSRDWLNPSLGYINTSRAREKIRYWFKRQERAENIERGKQLLDKELRRLSISLSKQEEIARLFKYESLDDFFAAIGYGGITLHQIAVKVAAQEEQPRVVEAVPPPRVMPSGIQVLGVGDLLTRLAHCCNPLPGDEIVGYITRNRGVTIHRKDCHGVTHEDEKERLIKVEWGHVAQLYPVAIRVDAWDRVGLLRDISAIVAEEKVNIASVSTEEYEDNTTAISLALEIKGVVQFSRLLSKIERVHGVINVARVEN
jgi:GTP pyrophosphokinase